MLLANAKDEVLENFWKRSQVLHSWPAIQSLRFELATTFSFSVWDYDPRADQIHNERRGRGTFDILTNLGIPTVPFMLCADEPEDYEAASRWLIDRPTVNTIADLAQSYRTPEQFAEFVARLHSLLRLIPRRLNILVVGACTRRRIRTLYSEFGKITIACKKPVYKAVRGGHELLSSGSSRYSPLFTLEQLVVKNINQVDRICREEARALRVALSPGNHATV